MPAPSLELSIFLLIVGLSVLALELFLPSAGLLFVIALCCVVLSIVVAFMTGMRYGMAMLAVDFVLAIFLPGIALRLWQMTPMGRRMFLGAPDEKGGEDDVASTAADGLDYQSLLEEIGKTVTPHRPAGTTDFGGRRVDTVSEGVMIAKNEVVRVIAVEGRRIVVRRLEDD